MTRQPYGLIKISQFRFVYIYTIATNASAAAPRLMAASEIAQTAHSRRQKDRRDPKINRNSANTKMYA